MDHNGGLFVGSGYNGGSGNPLQTPNGFKTTSSPNLSPNMRSTPPPPPPDTPRGFNSGGAGGGSDDAGCTTAIRGFVIPKNKRGRPRKSTSSAVGIPVIPTAWIPHKKTAVGTPPVPTVLTLQNKTAVGKPVPTALTPQNNTAVRKIVPIALTPQNKSAVGKPVPTALTPQNKTVDEKFVPIALTPQNISAVGKLVPTAPTPQKQKKVDENPDLSKLMPPSRSSGFKTGHELDELLKRASSVLISGIKEAADANEMIELASVTFMYFNSLGVDYTPVHKAVCSVIRLHCQKEALAKQKPHAAFNTKRVHDQAVVEFSQAEGRCAGVKTELEDSQREFDAVTAHVKRLSEELKNANEKKAKLVARLAAAHADKVSCDEAYSKAKSKMENIAPKMSEAQKAIDEFERRWKETMDRLNRAMDETSNIRILDI